MTPSVVILERITWFELASNVEETQTSEIQSWAVDNDYILENIQDVGDKLVLAIVTKDKKEEETTCYVVFKNSDMTEGRGPMVFDSVWLDAEKAAEYIDKQPGVMGRTAKWSEEKYGDWEIRPIKIGVSRFQQKGD